MNFVGCYQCYQNFNLTPQWPLKDDCFELWFADGIDRLGVGVNQQLPKRLDKTSSGYGMEISLSTAKSLAIAASQGRLLTYG